MAMGEVVIGGLIAAGGAVGLTYFERKMARREHRADERDVATADLLGIGQAFILLLKHGQASTQPDDQVAIAMADLVERANRAHATLRVLRADTQLQTAADALTADIRLMAASWPPTSWGDAIAEAYESLNQLETLARRPRPKR
jgi:hypothetical protein